MNEIRRIEAGDTDALAYHYRVYMDECYPERSRHLSEVEYKKVINQIIISQSSDIHALTSTNEIIGFIFTNKKFNMFACGETIEITDIYVTTENRRKGYGDLLLSYVQEICESHNVCRIELYAPSKSNHAHPYQWYASRGFQSIGFMMRKNIK